MSTPLRSKCRFLRIPLFAGFLLIAASLILALAAEARGARKAATAQSAASGRLLNVRSAVLMDARTGKILYSQNPDARIPPASLTKVMSMMVTFDAIRSGKVKLSDSIRVSRHAARQGGSRMGLRAGERVSLKRLLMGMAVSSGNDASMAVAERVGGSGRAFVKMMNRKARQIGMSSSTFKTPNGLPAAGQYTTARDMARLGYVYLKNKPSALQYHRVRVLKHRGAVTRNKNPLLGACPGADGLKTGWVTASGYNIISTVRRGNTRLIAVILGAESAGIRSQEVRRLVEAGFKSRTKGITVASALMSTEMLEQALLYPKQSVELDMTFQNIMSVNVPVYDFQTKTAEEGDIFPYGLAQTSGELDDAMTALSGVFEDMLELAQVEKTMQLLAQEIEKTRRRVNALEYVMIPDLQKNIKYISMKLEENENSTKVRLMKVKEMVLQDAHHYQY